MKKNLIILIRTILFKIIKKNRLINLLDLNPSTNLKTRISIFNEYGYETSLKKAMPLSIKGEPLPWYTYPAIEYLSQLDLKEKTVFEWGCGNSSLFYAKNAKEVFSIEDNHEWYEKISAVKPDNLKLVYSTDDKYLNIISSLNRKFDIIVIDASQRMGCSKIAAKYLAFGGLIILDNSDWHKNSAKIIRENNLIQVDFHGFGPLNNYTWTTSLFFSRDFNFTPKNSIQPAYAIGGLRHIID
jgi:hypothetical protein